jgi:hypothetical protein
MSAVEANVQSAQYVDFWNEILVPKFIKYKHILVDGLIHHSEAVFPSLPVKEAELDEIESWLPEVADDQRRCKITDEVLKFRAELALISAELTHGPARIWWPANLSQSSVACSFEQAA